MRKCEKIAGYNISPVFLRREMWSWKFRAFLSSPLIVFLPIRQFTGRWSDMVDWHAVNELLFRLDYRRRVVSIAGTRHEWFMKFKLNWQTIRLFDAFYRIVIQSGLPCFKPLYRSQRVEQLSGWDCFTTARWLLNDYDTWGYN